MSTTLIVIIVLVALWVLLNLRTSRPDGVILKNIHPYRYMMPFIMRGRNESIVYYDDYVRAEKLLEYLPRAKERLGADITHCLVAAVGVGLADNPSMNYFVSGRRLYQRKGRQITFSMKRVAKDKRAKLGVVKLDMTDGETFRDLVGRISDRIGHERSGQKTYMDKELTLTTAVPRPILNVSVKLLRWLDYHGLLPGSFIHGDGMYASAFIANLGSLEMGAAFHHLYEWGNCPLFLMVGKIEDRPVVEDGQVVARKILHLRWSYDERIDDGLSSRYGMDAVKRVLEDPARWLGCVAEDGSDAWPMGAPPEAAAAASRRAG